jgi:hypothetical protein
MTREEYLKLIRENDDIKDVISKATDPKEKRVIKAYTEDFLMKMYDNFLGPMMSAIEKDPDVVNKALTEIQKELIREDQEKK